MRRPSSVKDCESRIASSPSVSTARPARRYASAPARLAPRTAGVQPPRRTSSSQWAIAAGQHAGSPIGSPAAIATEPTVRNVTAAGTPVGNIAARSSRNPK